MNVWAILAAIIGTLAAILGFVGTFRSAGTARAALKSSPYEALASRVVTVEAQIVVLRNEGEHKDKKIAHLEQADQHKGDEIKHLRGALDDKSARLDGLLDYVRVLWDWVVLGSKPPPPPVPDHLHDVLPPLEWPERTSGTNTTD